MSEQAASDQEKHQPQEKPEMVRFCEAGLETIQQWKDASHAPWLRMAGSLNLFGAAVFSGQPTSVGLTREELANAVISGMRTLNAKCREGQRILGGFLEGMPTTPAISEAKKRDAVEEEAVQIGHNFTALEEMIDDLEVNVLPLLIETAVINDDVYTQYKKAKRVLGLLDETLNALDHTEQQFHQVMMRWLIAEAQGINFEHVSALVFDPGDKQSVIASVNALADDIIKRMGEEHAGEPAAVFLQSGEV